MKKSFFRKPIDLKNFKMPDDRLLSAKEAKALIKMGYSIHWIKCKGCSELGASIDNRVFCSSYCKENSSEKLSNIELGTKLIKENSYAQKDDLVNFKRKEMKVFETDCTPTRLSKKYSKDFTYILISDGEVHIAENLNQPLIKVEAQIKK